jgi:LysR family glycine cleavage system transcriptional activator
MRVAGGRQKLVHLNALRAFEAAARHLSFSAAAEELNVTPPAISQQIQLLEEYLGNPLFLRSKTGVSLTPQARAAYPDIRDGLQRLSNALARLRGSGVDRIVTLTAAPSFTAKWLLPRIERFRERQPQLELRLDTTDRLAEFGADGIDIGVRYGLGGYPGLACERLLAEDVVPVCSPALLHGRTTVTLAELARMTLIHDTTIAFDPTFPSWRTWFQARGIDEADLSRGLEMNSSLLAIQAAIDGYGVALGRSVLVAADLRAGRLVCPFDAATATRCAYWVVYPQASITIAKVKAVRDWLVEEAAG